MRSLYFCCRSTSGPSVGGSFTTRNSTSSALGLAVSPSAASAWHRITVAVSGGKLPAR